MIVYDVPPAWIQYDYNKDHKITGVDLAQLLAEWGQKTGSEDLALLLAVWGYTYGQNVVGDNRWYVWDYTESPIVRPDSTFGQPGVVIEWDHRIVTYEIWAYEYPCISIPYCDPILVGQGQTEVHRRIYDFGG